MSATWGRSKLTHHPRRSSVVESLSDFAYALLLLFVAVVAVAIAQVLM